MKILQFFKDFGTEAKCKAHFKEHREQEGVVCKRCKSTEHYWLQAKEQWQCKECKFRTTLKSGTIMHHSKMDFLIWYQVMAFMSFSKKGISAKEMQYQLGHSRYESIWQLMHKVREGMGKRDACYSLEDMVEIDEGYFRVDKEKKRQANKAGKGSSRTANTAVLAESTPIENEDQSQKKNHCRYFKMQALDSHKASEILNVIEQEVAETTILFSDKSNTYNHFSEIVEGHISYKSSKETTTKNLHWVHIAIGNARRVFEGIYHHMKQKYLQRYLDEFCYKLNRRYFGEFLFDRLVIALAQNIR